MPTNREKLERQLSKEILDEVGGRLRQRDALNEAVYKDLSELREKLGRGLLADDQEEAVRRYSRQLRKQVKRLPRAATSGRR